MKSLARSRLAEEVAARLQDEIAGGAIAGELPSCRDPAAGRGVSLPTVVAALQRLAVEGVLTAGKSRRPSRRAVRTAPIPLSQKRLMILHPRALGGLQSVTRDTQERQGFTTGQALSEDTRGPAFQPGGHLPACDRRPRHCFTGLTAA